MNDYLINGSTLQGIADSIRRVSESTDPIAVSDMASKIREMTGTDVVTGTFIVTDLSSSKDDDYIYANYNVTSKVLDAAVRCDGCHFTPSRFFVYRIYNDAVPGSESIEYDNRTIIFNNVSFMPTDVQALYYTYISGVQYDGDNFYTTTGEGASRSICNIVNPHNSSYKPQFVSDASGFTLYVGRFSSTGSTPYDLNVNGLYRNGMHGNFTFMPGNYQWVAIK